ncbi:helix-turn-helix domain-containing protein [Natrinema thermotolerans]|nr:helix-turn-helix domain-containing protein [Natrinema thermotolerans]
MHSSGQTSYVTERTEPSTDEQAYDVLDGKAKYVDIYYLMKGGETYTARELCNEISISYQKTSTYLNEMEDRGVVTYEKDGNTKIWFLDRPYSKYDPERIIEERTVVEEIIEERTVVEEVSPYKEFEDFLWAYRMLVLPSVFVLLFGVSLFVYKYVFYDLYPTAIGSWPEVITTAGLVCLLTILVTAGNEVR